MGWMDTLWGAGGSLPPIGTPAPNITMYDTANLPFNPSTTAGDFIIVIGSYTCDRYTDVIVEWNQMAIPLYVAYTLEAHPFPDDSPYCACLWPQGPALPQQQTYADRLLYAAQMQQDCTIIGTVVLDLPCNDFLKWGGFYPAAWYRFSNGFLCSSKSWPHSSANEPCTFVAIEPEQATDLIEVFDFTGNKIYEGKDLRGLERRGLLILRRGSKAVKTIRN